MAYPGQQSGFLDMLEHGDTVLADRGFTIIADDIALRGAKLVNTGFHIQSCHHTPLPFGSSNTKVFVSWKMGTDTDSLCTLPSEQQVRIH